MPERVSTSTTLACAECGYDLAGITGGGSCPECGYSVVSSVAGADLTWASPRWLGRLHFGLALVVVGVAFSLIAPFVWLIWQIDQTVAGPFANTHIGAACEWFIDASNPLLPIATALATYAGYIVACAREPGRSRMGVLGRWVVPLAWSSLVVHAVAIAIPDSYFFAGISRAMQTILRGSTLVLGIVTLLLFALHIAGVLRRYRVLGLARQLRISAIACVCGTVAASGLLYGMEFVPVVQEFVYEHFTVIMFVVQPLLIGLNLWVAIAFFRAGRRFKRAKRSLTHVPSGILGSVTPPT